MRTINSPSGKAGKITYWISTIWLALGMTSTGVVQLLNLEEEADMMTRLGYPLYFLTILGVWKLLGVVTILLPGKPVFLNLLREWAYAGFFFTASGAVFSHLAVGDSLTELFGPTLLLILTVISWYYKPVDKNLSQLRPLNV